jgi:hypothetical protein
MEGTFVEFERVAPGMLGMLIGEETLKMDGNWSAKAIAESFSSVIQLPIDLICPSA